MKRSKILLILSLAMIVITSWTLTFSYLFFHRYPEESEIRAHLAAETAGKNVNIDCSQGDIGLFKIEIQGEEIFYVEAVQKWIFPWDDYYETSR